MVELDVYISTIKHVISSSEEEAEVIKNLTKSLNQKTNKMLMEVGMFNDRLLLFILLLINTNKDLKLINNFEENIIKILKNIQKISDFRVSPPKNYDSILLNELDHQLIMANIIKENETMLIPDYNVDQNKGLEELEKIIVEKDKTNDEIVKIFDEVINFTEELANKINKL